MTVGAAVAPTRPAYPDGAYPDAAYPDAAHPDEADRTTADLRRVMRRQASTVAVVTTRSQDRHTPDQPVGCTLTSVVSISLDPALILFSLSAGSRSEQAWRSAERGVVHLLHEGQEGLSRRFAADVRDRFSPEVRWRWDAGRCPVLLDAMAWLTIAPAQRVPAGDHVIVIARVLDVVESAEGSPLLYHDGGYTRVDRRTTTPRTTTPSGAPFAATCGRR